MREFEIIMFGIAMIALGAMWLFVQFHNKPDERPRPPKGRMPLSSKERSRIEEELKSIPRNTSDSWRPFNTRK